MLLPPTAAGVSDSGAALLHRPAAIGVRQFFHGLDELRQGRLGIAGDRQVGFDVSAEILIVRFVTQLDGRDGDDLRSWLRGWTRFHSKPVERRHLMGDAVEILDLETKNDVGIADARRQRQNAGIGVQRMGTRKIHPQALVFDRRLEGFRQLDQ